MYATADDSAQCFDLHRVRWHGSFLAAAGFDMVCWFSAVDAESIRIALRQNGVDMRRLWRGTVHYGPERVTPNVIVERSFEEPVNLEEVQAIEDASAGCLETHRVKFSRTFFSVDRKRMLCLYEAPDAESVRVAQREAAMPVDRVWAFTRIRPPPSLRRD
jgi:Nickel responsive protein SCO4226-like